MTSERSGTCASCREWPFAPVATKIVSDTIHYEFIPIGRSCAVANDIVTEDDCCPEWTKRDHEAERVALKRWADEHLGGGTSAPSPEAARRAEGA